MEKHVEKAPTGDDSSFKIDDNAVRQIRKERVKTSSSDHKCRSCGYYLPLRLSSILPTFSKPSEGRIAKHLYGYNCAEEGRRASYVGFRLCSPNRRIPGHRDARTAINQHLNAEHLATIDSVCKDESKFKIPSKNDYDIIKIELAEAILLQKFNQHINVNFNV